MITTALNNEVNIQSDLIIIITIKLNIKIASFMLYTHGNLL